MNTRSLLTSSLLGLALLAAACGGASNAEPAPSDDPDAAAGSACLVGTEDCVDADLGGEGTDASAGMCAPGVTDCVDAELVEGLPADDFDADAAIQEARGVLGMHEEDLPEDVRISRRGDEELMLTEDYVLGRRTVQLEDDGSGHRVVSVTVELPDGPETFELQGG